MKEQAIDNRVIEGFNKFLEFYEPANVESATDFFTTGEIIKAIQDIFPVDIGVAAETHVIDRKIAWGTKNMTKGPAT